MTTKINLVTVIIPVFNGERYITDTLDSILKQTYTNFELLVVNDGSTDNTLQIVERYAQIDSRIKIVNKTNGGVSSARNAALSLVRGKYYTFIDSDDIVTSDYLESLTSHAQETNADVVSSTVRIDPDPAQTAKQRISLDGEWAVRELLYDGIIKNHSVAKLYRTARFKNIRFDETLAVGEDMEFVFRVLKKSKRIVVVDDMLYFYIQRPNSAMNACFSHKRADSYFAAIKIINTNGLSSDELKAARTKLFTEAFSVLCKCYEQRGAYSEIYEVCLASVRNLALGVLSNKESNVSQRIYAGFSIISPFLAIKAANTRRWMITELKKVLK